MMQDQDFVLFRIGELEMALPTTDICSVERSVLVSALPEAPEPVIGVVNYSGNTVPVIDLRARMGMSPREVGIDDHFLFTFRGKLMIALFVDEVSGVINIPESELKDSQSFWPGLSFVKSVSGHDGSILFVQDIEGLMNEDQHNELLNALKLMTSAEHTDLSDECFK